jgi:hypothetical protein
VDVPWQAKAMPLLRSSEMYVIGHDENILPDPNDGNINYNFRAIPCFFIGSFPAFVLLLRCVHDCCCCFLRVTAVAAFCV